MQDQTDAAARPKILLGELEELRTFLRSGSTCAFVIVRSVTLLGHHIAGAILGVILEFAHVLADTPNLHATPTFGPSGAAGALVVTLRCCFSGRPQFDSAVDRNTSI